MLSVKELWWKELLVMEELEESRTVWSQVEELWCFVASLKLGFVETFCLTEALLCCGFLRGLVQNVSSVVVFGASKREQVPVFPLPSCLMYPHPLPPCLCFSQFCCFTPPQPLSRWTVFSTFKWSCNSIGVNDSTKAAHQIWAEPSMNLYGVDMERSHIRERKGKPLKWVACLTFMVVLVQIFWKFYWYFSVSCLFPRLKKVRNWPPKKKRCNLAGNRWAYPRTGGGRSVWLGKTWKSSFFAWTKIFCE